MAHLVENYRETLKGITYVEIFADMIHLYDTTSGFAASQGESFADTEEDTPKRPGTGRGNRWDSGIKDLDNEEEAYFNTSDDEDEPSGTQQPIRTLRNGVSVVSKPLVDYNSDEDNDTMDADMSAGILPSNGNTPGSAGPNDSDEEVVLTPKSSAAPSPGGPPERLSEKRRREEDDEDELGKLAQHKRRNSSSSIASNSSSVLRRKKSFSNGTNSSAGNNGKPNKIAISLSPAIKLGGEKGGEENGS